MEHITGKQGRGNSLNPITESDHDGSSSSYQDEEQGPTLVPVNDNGGRDLVWCSRVSVVLVHFLSAAALAILAYALISESEHQAFISQVRAQTMIPFEATVGRNVERRCKICCGIARQLDAALSPFSGDNVMLLTDRIFFHFTSCSLRTTPVKLSTWPRTTPGSLLLAFNLLQQATLLSLKRLAKLCLSLRYPAMRRLLLEPAKFRNRP